MPVTVDYSRDELLTDFGRATLKDRYLLPEETSPQDLFARVADYYGDDEDHAQRLYDYMSRLWFMPSTPILSNGGTKRGLPISCFLNEVQDDLHDIASVQTENTFLASRGGGIGTYWGNLRSLGERVGQVGKTSGIVPFVKIMDSQTLAVSQGSLRRGSAAVYLDIGHPEIKEFLEIRRPTGGDPNRKCLNLHHGVLVPDAFMKAVNNDSQWTLKSPHTGEVIEMVDARDLWIQLLTARIETGEPYMIFIDQVNRANPPWLRSKGLEVKTSNLCVAPETEILTDKGYQRIDSLEDQETTVWNGEKWSKVTVKKTGSAQGLLSVTFDNGEALECTPYHKFYIQETYGSTGVKEVRAHELKEGDKLIKFQLPIIEGEFSLEAPYTSGFFAGDGTYGARNTPVLHLYGDKKNLVQYFSQEMVLKGSGIDQASGRQTYVLNKGTVTDKSFVPNEKHTIKARLAWLSGLLDADACVVVNQGNQSVQLSATNGIFLRKVRRMLQTLGCETTISIMHEERTALMPDGTGGQALYNCKAVERLLISSNEVQHLLGLGLQTRRLSLSKASVQREARRFVKVTSVTNHGRRDDTYCFTEPLRGMGIFNGVLTGNCSEITLPTSQERTAVCCLSSLNVEKFDEWREDRMFIFDVMAFLDNVLEDFIKKADPKTHAKAIRSARAERSIGLGVMGLHSYFQKHRVPMDDPFAQSLNKTIFAHIDREVDLADKDLARLRGPCPDNGKDRRFSNRTAIAPTASISIICGGTSAGIEPAVANAYTHKTLSGSFPVRNKFLQQELAQRDMDTEEVWTSIITREGSVQHLDGLDEYTKAVFKTAFELDQFQLVRMNGERQAFIDQAISFNIFLPGDVPKGHLHGIHMLGWEMGMKSFYYCRSRSVARAETVSDKVTREIIEEEPNYEVCDSCQ